LAFSCVKSADSMVLVLARVEESTTDIINLKKKSAIQTPRDFSLKISKR
jgi:hypothetical protein